MNLDEYSQYDACGLAELVQKGDVTPKELAQLAAKGVERVNPALNAIVEFYQDRLDNGFDQTLPDGPFHGVPMLNKDLSAGEAGCLEEMGSPLAKGRVMQEDSLVFSQFRKAGFFNLGRATTAEYGLLGITENRATGITRNPWDTNCTPGGSSGGSAAMVAAGAVPLASGGDAGGSIRVPAAYCGIVGLKPSRGRISQGPARSDAHVGISTPFALTRSVRDCAVLLDCLSVGHAGDPYRMPLPGAPFQTSWQDNTGPLKVAYLTESWYGYDTNAAAHASVMKTVDFLRQEGHEVVQDGPQIDYQAFINAALNVWSAGLVVNLKSLAERFDRPNISDHVLSSTARFFERGCEISAETYIRSLMVFQEVTAAIGSLFETYDLLVLPMTPRSAPPVSFYDPEPGAEIDFAQWHNSVYANDVFAGVFNVSGNPAISLPLHYDETGMPMGVQIAAPFGDEARLLQISRQFEQAFPWAGKTPPVHVTKPLSSNGDMT
ncbi:amidase [Shimia gijangensis]|uniref:Amidase n=1 Tax=Shimia gijangensis TaxID=1470563 RepID=A0A1M6N435_9RHOB|nr:amidase [Shimia gijangensis]SHJ90440.1 amidase [Shimia gijangensis]